MISGPRIHPYRDDAELGEIDTDEIDQLPCHAKFVDAVWFYRDGASTDFCVTSATVSRAGRLAP
jgi:hypothetical protein